MFGVARRAIYNPVLARWTRVCMSATTLPERFLASVALFSGSGGYLTDSHSAARTLNASAVALPRYFAQNDHFSLLDGWRGWRLRKCVLGKGIQGDL